MTFRAQRGLRLCLTALALVVLAYAWLEVWIRTAELPRLDAPVSASVLDRDDQVLRVFVATDGRWRLPVSLDTVDKGYLEQLLAYEDKRFYRHNGVDLRAMARAAFQSLRAGEIRSGGSTLTMQVARLLEHGGTGRWRGKLRQIRVALALERELSKSEILEIYLMRAPFGGNLEGVRAATFSYFDKDARRLTPAQAALLVALPQSPETRRPDRAPEAALAARNRVLQRMVQSGVVSEETYQSSIQEPAPTRRLAFPTHAPHLADRLRKGDPKALFYRTTLDGDVQMAVEKLALEHVRRRSPYLSTAIIVMDHRSGAVLVSVGGPDYLDSKRAGFLDMTRAVRSPGSTLKPLIYALAFEDGLAHPETLVNDRPTSFGGYAPQNFDKRYRGIVTASKALQLSLNIPAVALLDAVGPAKVMARMRRLDINIKTPGGQRPGLALALGGFGVSLEEMTRLFGALANGGQQVGMHVQAGAMPMADARLVETKAAWYVLDILSRAPTPGTASGDGIAFKTGTSYGHRDAWAIGFDGAHVVGVWLGRPDAAAMPGVLGIDAAAPLLFETFSRISPTRTPLPPPPSDALIVSNVELPLPLKSFAPRNARILNNDGPQIAYPPDGARIDLSRGDALIVKLKQAQTPLIWLVDGKVVDTDPFATSLIWQPEGQGFVAVSVIDAIGRSARTMVFVE